MIDHIQINALVDATIDQIHDLSERLADLVAKDNQLLAAGEEGKFSPKIRAKVYNLLAVPLRDQIGKAN